MRARVRLFDSLSARGHLRILLLATLVWAGFLAAGWPSYYQQYSRETMIWFEVLLLGPISAVVYLVLRPVDSARRLKVAVWLAFYFTVPFAFYDWLYCGVYLGYGTAFLWRFWYLSVYYLVPWIVLPSVALLLDRRPPATKGETP